MRMPSPRLTPYEERRYFNVLRTLEAEGVDVNIPDDLVRRVTTIDISIAAPPESEVFERASGGLSYFLSVRLLALKPCIIDCAEIRTAFDDQIALESPDEKYPIGMLGCPPVPHKELLNRRIEKGLRFARAGDLVKGFILATGVSRFPQGYRTGELVPVTLSLYDQFGTEIVKHGQLFVQRAEALVRRTKKRSGYASIYEQPDLWSSENGPAGAGQRISMAPPFTEESGQKGTFTQTSFGHHEL
jgi:hypothetical protein